MQALALFSRKIWLFWEAALDPFLWLQVLRLCLHVTSLKNLKVKNVSRSPLNLVQ